MKKNDVVIGMAIVLGVFLFTAGEFILSSTLFGASTLFLAVRNAHAHHKESGSNVHSYPL